MKTFISVTIIFCFALSCSSSKHSNSYDKTFEKCYVEEFKLQYFKRLLIKAYNNSDEIIHTMQLDHSHFSEPILSMDDHRITDSFITIDNHILVKDSINRIGRVAEGAEGKKIIAYALEKYNSRWLDSLAKTRYKIVYK